MLREELMAEKRASPGGTTAVSCCGANPGMVSWFLKRALLIIAKDVGLACKEPATRAEWGALAMALGVEGIHIAERDTQTTGTSKPHYSFWNTWSVEGFLSEAMQPAELGWGTHEKWMPEFARQHEVGSRAAIYLDKPGAKIKVRSWCPTPGPQFAFLVTHNESISISDYFTVRAEDGAVAYRPTCHYAYHPCDQAILSIFDMLGSGISPDKVEEELILDEQDIIEGMDELGVLVYGHKKNAYWYGSRLTIEQTRALAPYQNATGLQVTSAVLAGIVWALEHPARGIVEADEMDYQRCLQVQEPYLG